MRVYIANLGKYNEGELVGDWFSFPIDEEDVAERIGLNSYYEEYAVHDTDNFPIEIGEYISIQELNEMYEMICELPDYITDALDEFVSHYGSLEEVYEHKDDIYFYQCRGRRRGWWFFLMGNGHEPVRRGLETSAYGGEIRKGIRHIRVRPLSAGNHTGGKWRDSRGRYAEFREHGLTA